MVVTPPVAEIERRLRWPALPALVFLGLMLGLLAVAALATWLRPGHPRGLPEDAALLAATGLPDATLGVIAPELRFRAAAIGGDVSSHANVAAALARVSAAEHALAHWALRHPGEPRVRAALGALALARHDYAAAETHYREACERAPHYGEGRLGWGFALALDAARTSDPWLRRALTLRAIAQFAAVDPNEPEYPHALYNRAHLLADVGRQAEATNLARQYLAMDPSSEWAKRLRSDLQTDPRPTAN
jgi:tetratricopeptide (TPR) repeat protein